jgi:hypothetical protein
LEREAGLKELGTDSGRAYVKKPFTIGAPLFSPIGIEASYAQTSIGWKCGDNSDDFCFRATGEMNDMTSSGKVRR